MSNDKNRTTVPTPNVEQSVEHEPLAEEQASPLDTRVDINVISYRKANHDPDGISAKAVIDGIVRLGLLPNDSAKEVRKVSYESFICAKGEEERTVIEII